VSAQLYESHAPGRNGEALVLAHADLVKRIAYHVVGRLPSHVEVDDLIQSGMIGLLEAAQSFTRNRGASFETYAGIRIRGAMFDALRKLDWAPRSVHRKAREVAAAIHSVEACTGREASDAEIADRLGVPLEEYHEIVQDALGCHLLRLDESDDDQDGTTLDRIPSGGPDPQREVLDDAQREAVIGAIKRLPERERLVLSLYYEQELNLKEVGAALQVTESRACQLHGRAMLRLRRLLSDWRE
jgi:RNA polymerase sigma factor for flagellar operon FliA